MKPSVEKRKKRTFAAISQDGQRSLALVQSIPGQKRIRFATIHSISQRKQFQSCSSDDNETSRNSVSCSSCGHQSSCCSTLSCSGEEYSSPRSDTAGEMYDMRPLPLFIESTPSSIKPTCLSTLTLDLKMVADEKYPISPLFLLSSDMMAGILTFLEPVEVLNALTSPLCKDWCEYYTCNRDLWRVLCLSEPFNLKNRILLSSSDIDDSSYCSLKQPTEDDKLGRHRLMYTSFVRCMRYLKQIKEGCRNGNDSQQSPVGAGRDLKQILARKNNLVARSRVSNNPSGVLAIDTKKPKDDPPSKKPKYGESMITSKLLGPSSEGKVSHMNLPQSCAIFSIVSWMVAYPEVEGIQTMCIEALPYLLEDGLQRLTAQRASLAEFILKAMLSFPDALRLHIAALHALVLLGRPLGGQEGMLIDLMESPMALGGAAFVDRGKKGTMNGVNTITTVLGSMLRFEQEEKLQAMACWALVNLALVPAQKSILMKLGGIETTLNAMRMHPKSLCVQFRGLFALINLVVPCKNLSPRTTEMDGTPQNIEKEILDGHVGEIANLVVAALQTFHSSKTIRNRAYLVFHNLSLSRDYLPTLLWTRHCYKLLGWCAAKDLSDQMLRRSAVGALRRIEEFLSRDENLRTRFAQWILAEHQALPNILASEALQTQEEEEGRHI